MDLYLYTENLVKICPGGTRRNSMPVAANAADSGGNDYNPSLYELGFKNSIRDAHTPQPGEIVFNTMTYRSSETVHRLG